MAINMIETVDTLYCLRLRKPHISGAGSASVFRHNRERETLTMVGQLERTTSILNPWTFPSLSLSWRLLFHLACNLTTDRDVHVFSPPTHWQTICCISFNSVYIGEEKCCPRN